MTQSGTGKGGRNSVQGSELRMEGPTVWTKPVEIVLPKERLLLPLAELALRAVRRERGRPEAGRAEAGRPTAGRPLLLALLAAGGGGAAGMDAWLEGLGGE